MDKENIEYKNIMEVYSNNIGENLGFNVRKHTLDKEKKVNVIKKMKKR